ncbi:MAG: amino acid adenylation domain-containing protein, partial [Caulobacteraceae bacterium]
MLREAFKRWRGDPALWISGRSYSYGELFGLAVRLAATLRERVRPGEGIGILAQGSYPAYVGVLASLLANRPYVPLNMKFPYERQLTMARVARCAVLISDQRSAKRHEELDRALDLKGAAITDAALRTAAFEGGAALGDWDFAGEDSSLAYIMFTSGTTGTPKGVAVRRENLRAYLEAVETVAPIRPGARCTQLFDLSFDLSVHDIFRTWTGGGCLYVMDNEEAIDPVGFARRNRLECWFSVPSVVGMAKRLKRLAPGALPDLRLSLFCGEALAVGVAEEWRRAAPNARLLNLYGPTEATIAITAYEYSASEAGADGPATVPLGHAFASSAAIVVGVDDRLATPGSVGEVWLGGAQISSGYINNEGENRRRFVDALFDGYPHQRWYRTGDLARADSRRGLLFEGRVDEQTKIQGYRVELLEVEAALRQAAGAAEVA